MSPWPPSLIIEHTCYIHYIYWEYFRFSVVSLLALWPYPSSGIILSNSFILSIYLILLSVIPSFYYF